MADERRVLDYESGPVPPGTYTRQWRAYELWGAAPVIVFIGWPFVVGPLLHLFMYLTGWRVPGLLFFGPYIGALGWTIWRAATRPCPRCGNVFDSRPGYKRPFARHCVHCGLPKWAGR